MRNRVVVGWLQHPHRPLFVSSLRVSPTPLSSPPPYPFPRTQAKLSAIHSALPISAETLLIEFDIVVDAACDVVVSKAFGTLPTVTSLRDKAAAGFRKTFPDLHGANERAIDKFVRPLLAKAVAVFETWVKAEVGALPVDEAIIDSAAAKSLQQGLDELGPVGTRLGQVYLETVVMQVSWRTDLHVVATLGPTSTTCDANRGAVRLARVAPHVPCDTQRSPMPPPPLCPSAPLKLAKWRWKPVCLGWGKVWLWWWGGGGLQRFS